jgi:glycosyltransferase involved in cell wall biosynthesis
MNNEPLVSVIMVTYNHEKYVAEAIKSVLMQKTGFSFQLIIGEDCSKDKTRKIVEQFAMNYPARIKAVLNSENSGVHKNAQNIYKVCTGKYIAMLDGDDFWTDQYKLQKQVDFLEAYPEFGLVHTDFNLLFYERKKIITNYNQRKKIKIPEGYIFEDLIYSPVPLIKTCTTVIRNKMVDFDSFYSVVFKRKWHLGDLPLWLEISKKSKVGYIPKATATYRLLKESASKTKDIKKHHEFLKSVYDIKFYYWEKYCKKIEIKEKLDMLYHLMLLNNAYEMYDNKLAQTAYNFFKNHNMYLPIKHKAKYWAVKNRLLRFFIDMAKKIKNYLLW